MSLNVDFQLGIDRAANEVTKEVEKAFVSKLNAIGRELVEENGCLSDKASRFEIEQSRKLSEIGKLLAALDLKSKTFAEDIGYLRNLGVGFSFDHSAKPIISADPSDGRHMKTITMAFPKIRVELITTIGER